MAFFFKVSGGGNDFIALPEPERDPSVEEIRAWCRRGLSVGADGLFVLRQAPAGNAVIMDHRNADGSHPALCLNGTRCAARLAFHLGWARDAVEVRTGAGAIQARAFGEGRVALEIPPPQAPARQLSAAVGSAEHSGWHIHVGVPHFILLWPESLEDAPVESLGRQLVQHPAFGAEGANIDLVRFLGPDLMEIRSYERGVFTETLACGTGVMAATGVGLQLGLARLPISARTRGGFELQVAGDVAAGRPQSWSLAGDARIIAQGSILPEASQLPAAGSPGRR